MLPFVFLFVKIGEVRREELGHPESPDLVRPEDLRHLLVGGEVLLVFRVLGGDGRRPFNEIHFVAFN